MENTHKSTTENQVSDSGVSPLNQGIALPTSNLTHGVTQVVAPAAETSTTMVKMPKFHNPIASSDFKDYLSRPTLYASGSFSSGSTAYVYTKTFLPSDISAIITNISGAYGYRATVCFRVEVAAAPQAAGIVRLSHEYMPISNNPKSLGRPVSAQLPGAEINLRSASAVEHKIPFVSDRDFWPFINGVYTKNSTAFQLTLWPYAPVNWDTTVVSTPTWCLYIWLEDLEFVSKSMPTVAVTPQAGVGPEADHGKVSTWFRYASKIATFASSIPALTSLALPVSWAFDAGAKIAAHFGWSKPNDGSYSGVMGMSMTRGVNTCADADFANPMGYYANNEVGVLPGFAGNDLDEMSLCHLTCKPGLIATLNLLPGDARGNVKWVSPVAPACFVYQGTTAGFAQVSSMGIGSTTPINNNKLGYYPSPIAFFSSFFERWRGDIIFRFKFNTTKFHAGKVLIGYVPGEDVSDGTTLGGFSQAPNPAFRYDFTSVILDLRTTEEYDFVVPFTYPASWCDTGMTLNISGTAGVPNIGSIFMRIIEPLYGPDNVPQNAQVLVEVLAECGLELSQPITSIMLPQAYGVAPTVVAQSGVDIDPDYDAVVHATGERILSIKQLAMRPYWTSSTTQPVAGANLTYAAGATYQVSAGAYYRPIITTDSIISRLSSCFALVRGGLVVRSMPIYQGTVTPTTWYSSYNWAPFGIQTILGAAFGIETRMSNFVRIPYYGKNTRMRTGWVSPSGGGNSDPNGTTRTLVRGFGGTTDSSSLQGVAAADDFQLGAFTGVPACVTFEPNYAPTQPPIYVTKPLNT